MTYFSSFILGIVINKNFKKQQPLIIYYITALRLRVSPSQSFSRPVSGAPPASAGFSTNGHIKT